MSVKKVLFFICMTIFFQGCANKQILKRELATNASFTLVRVTEKDSFASLAEEYLGHAKYASVVQRYNPGIDIAAANYVAVPLKSINASAVFSNGYQTIPILCYHQFTRDKTGKSRMVVPEHEFREQMTYLSNNGYQVVPLSDIGLFIRGKKELPDKAVVITIDDGYKSYMDIAFPILKEYGFPSTMFVYPEFVGAGIALNWRDVNALNDEPLVDIQSHSKTHDSLSRKPSGELDANYVKRLEKEVVDAEKIISKRTGNTINQFAYPYGNTSVVLVDMLKENEYDLAVTVQRGSNPAFSSPFLLNRTMIYGGDSMRKFTSSLDVFIEVNTK
ncbi:polysaccharide deacetylase family protein [Agaribacter marinus]|uniref:NodB homology domain-containing protein n=1 Tax=Agaribacter marinus TaxID=1431249 RepID=A0AA37T193_9ALTE|nr:polysaccharide deacetylase family protein [Agaribacter marinus]GLR71910.1 hypothetical protein GCM10007852_28180 [Agaribacter marinus]